MSFVLARALCVVMGYFFGLIETGELIAKSQNRSLRQEGSGNIGSTNSLRVLGVKWGFITLAGDIGKCMLAMFIAFLIFKGMFPPPENGYRLLMLYAGIGAILGHDYPFYHSFKGGKGVACVGGIAIAFVPVIGVLAVLIFVIVVAICKYVSLGSMIGECSLAVLVAIFGHLGLFVELSGAYLREATVIFVLIALLCIFQHRSNIGRMARGEEHKISFKNAGTKEQT